MSERRPATARMRRRSLVGSRARGLIDGHSGRSRRPIPFLLRRQHEPAGQERPREVGRGDVSQGSWRLAASQLSGADRATWPGPQTFQFLQDLVEAQPLDELHDVVAQAVVFADAEDRHDVGVVQLRRRLRLALEATLRPGVLPELLGQDLEGDVPAERDLLRLVDDAHAAVADLADDAVVAQALERRQRTIGRRLLHAPGGFP